MSLRGKTQKAKKFGTPTETTAPAPKTPSPKVTKIVRTVTAPTVTTGAPRTKPTVTRKVITPTAAGIAAQEQFKSQIQTLTAPIRNTITALQHRLADQAGKSQYYQGAAYTHFLEEKKETEELIQQKEMEIEEIELRVIESEEIIEEPIIELPELLPEVSAEPDSTITDNMVTQQLINFNIVNGRAVGSIKFMATNSFNPFWYGKNIFNIVQFKTPNGANILTYVKQNNLNFTETERDEVISYDEDMKGNTRATVESHVWAPAPSDIPFSKMYSIEISEAEPPKPITTGFMSAGIAGAIAGLVLIGFIADHKRGN